MRRVGCAFGLMIAAGASAQVDIRVVAAEGDQIPGTPYTIRGLPEGQAIVTDGGLVVFEAWTSDPLGSQRPSVLVVDATGVLHLVEREGSPVPGLAVGTVFDRRYSDVIPDFHHGATTQNISADQVIVSARFRDDAGNRAGGGWIAWDADQGAHVFLLDEQTVSINGESRRIRLWTAGFDNSHRHVQFDSAGRRVMQMLVEDVDTPDVWHDAVFRWSPSVGLEPILIAGAALPGSDGGTEITRFDEHRAVFANPDGSVFVRVHLTHADGSSEYTMLLVLESGDIVSALGPGDEVPSIPGAPIVLSNENHFATSGNRMEVVTFDDPAAPGMTETAYVLFGSDASHRLVARTGFQDPGLSDGQFISKFGGDYRKDEAGNVIIEAWLADAAGTSSRYGVFAVTPDGDFQEIVFEGDALPTGEVLTDIRWQRLVMMLGEGGHASVLVQAYLDGVLGPFVRSAWAWGEGSSQAFAYPGVTIPGLTGQPTDPFDYQPFLYSHSIQANGDTVFDADGDSHGGGLRVRSSNGVIKLLTFEDQEWDIDYGGASFTLSSPWPGLLRSSSIPDTHGEVLGPDAVGPGTTVAMYWSGDNGDLLTLVSPDPCPADVNDDGQIAPSDFNAWILAYNSNNPACDQNGDGECRPNDFSAWILNFNAGCP
ncbi:MAG: GC-type dockerin domain-anchored protein [Planctomycetota bacterium]